ncbi:uncharacterized protein LOC133779586 [Humulus lupulus]|uniref:uncharacterized protein LOC133779586 n=1 Tax=Humulus lupulus TaxID=3486 RepID=UPI002B401932|nr:uncharacterized protein LOC133779586 [Humulus lupulus]
MSKSANEACELPEEMEMNNYQWSTERGQTKKVAGMIKLDAITMLTTQVAALTKQLQQSNLSTQTMQVQSLCGTCGNAHPLNQHPAMDMNNIHMEEVEATGNCQRPTNKPFLMSYNQGWKNHPNFSWTNNQATQQPFPQSQQQFPPPQPQPHQPTHMKQPEVQPDVLNQFITETRASIRSLKTQMGQLATLMINRAQGNLPSTTKVNPKEQCNAISLRSVKELKEPKVVDKEKEVNGSNVTENLEKKLEISIDHHIKIPYPQSLQKNKLDKKFSKFLDIFRKLHINIPFAEALEQIPSYVTFMKEFFSKKRKLEDYETVALTESVVRHLRRNYLQSLKIW